MYSRYYATAVAGNPATLVHTISNAGNANFAWLLDSHLELYVSSAGQSLDAFKVAIAGGSTAALTLNNDYTLDNSSGDILILAGYGLTADATYRLHIKRVTPKGIHFVNFQAGSPLTELDLDNSNNYALFRSQELEDDLEVFVEDGSYTLTLEDMKTVAGVTGDFTGTTDTQTMTNKAFTAGEGITTTFDLGTASWQ